MATVNNCSTRIYKFNGMEAHSLLNALDLAVTRGQIEFHGSFTRLEENRKFSSTHRGMDAKYLEKQFVDLRTNLIFPNDIKLRDIVASDAYVLQPMCHCHYPQPPDADLITIDCTYIEDDKYFGNYDSMEVLPYRSRRNKSLWKRTKRCLTHCIVYVGWRLCC